MLERKKRQVGLKEKSGETYEVQLSVQDQPRSQEQNEFFNNMHTTAEESDLEGLRVNRSKENIHHPPKVYRLPHNTPPGRPTYDDSEAFLVDEAAIDPGDSLLTRYPGQDDYVSPQVAVVGVSGQSVELPCRIPSMDGNLSSGGSTKFNKDRSLDTAKGEVNSFRGRMNVAAEEKANSIDSGVNSKNRTKINAVVDGRLNFDYEDRASLPNDRELNRENFSSVFHETAPHDDGQKTAQIEADGENTSTQLTPQPPELLLWYRNDGDKPIYSYDARPGRIVPSHWRSDQISPRSRFDPARNTLILHDIELKDAGQYSCSVHYRTGPTLTASATLDIIEPPTKVWIGSSSGGSSGIATRQNYSNDFVVRRLVEGGTLRLTCYAEGGHPVPQITWWDGDRRLDTADLTRLVTERKQVFHSSQNAKDKKEAITTADRVGSTASELKKTLHNLRHRKEGKRELQEERNVTMLYRKRNIKRRINSDQGKNSFLPERITNRKLYVNSTNLRGVDISNSILTKNVPSSRDQIDVSRSQVDTKPLLARKGTVRDKTKRGKRRRSLNYGPSQSNNSLYAAGTNKPLQSFDKRSLQLRYFIAVNGNQSVKTLYAHTSDSPARKSSREGSYAATSSRIFTPRKRPGSLISRSSNSPISQTRISNILKQEDGLHSNSLVVEALGREDHQRIFTCRVTNSNVTNAILRTATLDMILNPTRLWVEPSPAPLVAGRVSVFVCTTTGDRPPVQLSWTLDGQPIQHSSIQSMRHIDETVSRLSLTLSPDHDSARLTCSFTPLHPRLQPLSDSVQLHVEYAPTAHLTPGRSVSLSDVQEGDDVYFECEVSASPPVSSVRWQKQDKDLHHSAVKGIILSNRSLVLQRVSSSNSGNYTCLATNSRGTGVSNTLQLIVKYAPKCGEQEWSTKGASIGSKVIVPCVLDALPLPSEVTWTFNSTSGHTARIDQAHVRHRTPAISLVVFVPRNGLDFGTLHCWGRNSVGTQHQPCTFTVFPAAKPDAPSKCHQVQESGAMVQIECDAGNDGGLNVTFFLEILSQNQASPSDVYFEDSEDSSNDLSDAKKTQSVEIVSNAGQSGSKNRKLKLHSKVSKTNSSEILVNVSSITPSFKVHGLGPGSRFLGAVTSCNSEGCASSDVFEITRLPDILEKKTAAMKPAPVNASISSGSNTLFVLLALGASAVLLLLFLTLALFVMKRLRARSRGENLANDVDHNSEVLDSRQKDESHVDILEENKSLAQNDRVCGTEFVESMQMCGTSAARTARTLPSTSGGLFLNSINSDSVNPPRCDILSGLISSPSAVKNVVHKNIDRNISSVNSTSGLASNCAQGSTALLKKSKNLIELKQIHSTDIST
ncbi:CD80-like immunoglobulin C2-set [Trinorchestia longiramus]|nr:CD80-like immunoglobulin C2-set [Trinorchestia longiramus]